jgi:opacity protein-like surface antigen
MIRLNNSSSFRTLPWVAASMWALNAVAADPAATTPQSASYQKPAWLTELSLGVKEGYDDNVLLVSGKGLMKEQDSFITTVSPKVGFNFAPLTGRPAGLQSLTLAYTPDFAIYHGASAESYDAHRISDSVKGGADDFSYALDNAFLFNDGSRVAPTYGVGSTADTVDKNRNAYATAVPRERRKQIQDRAAVVLQYDWQQFFVRPTASLLDCDLMTDLHKSAGVYTGYQNYVDRSDLNGGADVGYKVTPDLALTLGYRYGHQYQQALPSTVDATYHASSDYQRILLGLEGTPLKWLQVKLLGGPDFRDYNHTAPLNDLQPLTYYGEASLTATPTSGQTIGFTYKQWQWVSSTGKLPYFDSTFALAYHWSATKKLGVDLVGKYLESDYTMSEASLTANSCIRDDVEYTVSAGLTYAFTPHLIASAMYTYNLGRNVDNLPASVAATEEYRDFDQQLVSLGLQYKF